MIRRTRAVHHHRSSETVSRPFDTTYFLDTGEVMADREPGWNMDESAGMLVVVTRSQKVYLGPLVKRNCEAVEHHQLRRDVGLGLPLLPADTRCDFPYPVCLAELPPEHELWRRWNFLLRIMEEQGTTDYVPRTES